MTTLDDNLTPQSFPQGVSTVSMGKPKTGGGYYATWDSPEYLEKNNTKLVQYLQKKSDEYKEDGKKWLSLGTGVAAKSLSSPGKFTLGGMTLYTTPKGIVLSDGYEFEASPEHIGQRVSGDDSYSSFRRKMNEEFRANNDRRQYYFIP